MQVKIGDIVEGKVTGLTNFGAFVKLTTGEVGMVHISEVASAYVKDIKDHLSEGQDIKVKVLAVGDNGKISLSIKQAQPEQPKEKEFKQSDRKPYRNPNRGKPPVWQGRPAEDKPQSFEDMMAKFKQISDEKQADIKRSGESRHGGGYNRRGSNKY